MFVRPGANVAEIIWNWLNNGATPVAKTTPQAAPATVAPTGPPLSADEYAAWLEDFDAAAIARNLSTTASATVLGVAMTKAGCTTETITADQAGKFLAALQAGKWDAAITKRATEAQAAAAPAPVPAPAPAPVVKELTPEMTALINTISNWQEFLSVTRDIAGDTVNDVEYQFGIVWAVKKIDRVGRTQHISKAKMTQWATAIAQGTFDWTTGEITKQEQAKAA
jgi:hypothetical protein